MRHRKTVNKIGRTAAHRKSTLANLSAALFERKHIQTTVTKAKATRRISERLITLAKKDTTHARRMAFKQLKQKRIVKILFDEIGPRYIDRSGGYTRVVKLGQRQGDGADMAILELVGFETASKKKKNKEVKEGGKKKKGTKETKDETAPSAEEKKDKIKKAKTKDKSEAEDKKKDRKKDVTNKENQR